MVRRPLLHRCHRDERPCMLEVSWLLFVVASLLLILTPGQDMLLVMSRSLAQGPAAGVVTAAGVSMGLIGHTVLATLGLGAIVRTSETLFLALKIVGAIYLIYLAVGLLRTRGGDLALGGSPPRSLTRLFVDGAFSNVSNPKIAVFYFAFMPQFVLPGAAHPTRCIFVLGLLFAALTLLVKGPVGLFAGLLSGWLRARPRALLWIYRSSGLVLLGLGIKLATERRP
jgi:threonine/homoserine/homoserine lactone efflux protein